MMKKIFNLYNFTIIKILIINFFTFGKKKNINFIYKNIKNSYSQIFQDLFVIYVSNIKKSGSFIEIGVGNGKDLSNTYLLEKKYGWRGILCEPDERNFKNIEDTRNSKLVKSLISENCNDNVKFYLNEDPYSSSTNKNERTKKQIYTNSICLNHLFEKFKLKDVDYISIDTEGNEYEILKNFNFDRYKVRIFTIEHNFNKNKRYKIKKLLKNNGYKNVLRFISHMDDWYVLEKLHL